MNWETERNQRIARKTEKLLCIYQDEDPPSLEDAIRLLQVRGGPAFDLDDPETAPIDLLTGLRHYLRLGQNPALLQGHASHADLATTPELERMLHDLQRYCREHDVSWEATVCWSEEHFENDVGGEVQSPGG